MKSSFLLVRSHKSSVQTLCCLVNLKIGGHPFQIGNECRSHLSHQKRYGSIKSHTRENTQIAAAIRRMTEASPEVTLQVERINLVGCSGLLPYQLETMIEKSVVRMKVLTHVDTLSEAALRHQLAYVEEQEMMRYPASKNYIPTAIVAVNVTAVQKEKELRLLKDAIFGATQLANNNQVWVCGSPNSGKSSLILPLTKNRTMLVRNKKAYHLPKISESAGKTLGIKKHVMESDINSSMYHMEASLIDMPGIRPRIEDPRTPVALMFAARASETFPTSQDICPGDRILQVQLEACNRHELLTQQYEEYMKEVPGLIPNRPSRTEAQPPQPASLPFDEKNPLQHIRPKYVDVFKLDGATNDPRLLRHAAQKLIPNCNDKKIMTKFHQFECGGMVFTQTHKYHHILKNFACSMKFHYGSPIIYMNDAAVRLVDIHHGRAVDFEPNSTDRYSDDEEDDPNDPRYNEEKKGSGDDQFPDINREDAKNYRMK
jgi:50S ribosome-binding GTPase